MYQAQNPSFSSLWPRGVPMVSRIPRLSCNFLSYPLFIYVFRTDNDDRHVHVHVCACVCMCVHVCACACVSAWWFTHVFPDRQRLSTRACACVCMCMCMYSYIVTHHHTLLVMDSDNRDSLNRHDSFALDEESWFFAHWLDESENVESQALIPPRPPGFAKGYFTRCQYGLPGFAREYLPSAFALRNNSPGFAR